VRPSILRPGWRTHLEVDGNEHLQEAFDAIVSRLDGSRSLEEAVGQALVDGSDPGALAAAVGRLREAALIVPSGADPADDPRFAGQVTFFDQLLVHQYIANDGGGAGVQQSVNQAKVLLVGDDRLARRLAESLHRAGDTTVYACTTGAAAAPDPEGVRGETGDRLNVAVPTLNDALRLVGSGDVDLVVGVAVRGQHADLTALNAGCLRAGVPLLVGRSAPLHLEVGPLVVPHDTACFVCLLLRERSAAGVDELSAPGDQGGARLNFEPSADLLALECLRWLGGLTPTTRSRVWRLDLVSGASHFSPVLKLPRCPACGVHRSAPERRLWDE
jgi:bacteriocin biosynthesis cyclodehydratase domain-containing protein